MMATSTYLLPYGQWDEEDIVFRFDAPTKETRRDPYKATRYAIESGAEVSDFVIEEPKELSLSGVVSAWYARDDDERETRLQDVHGALVALADARQPVTAVCGTWVFPALITRVDATKSHDTGEALEIEIALQNYVLVEYEDVEIPAELLAEDVKAGATKEDKNAQGGEGSTAEAGDEDEGAKSWAASGLDTAKKWFAS
jgi:hypothetical protein